MPKGKGTYGTKKGRPPKEVSSGGGLLGSSSLPKL
jgi:hypothetical protein